VDIIVAIRTPIIPRGMNRTKRNPNGTFVDSNAIVA